MRKIRFRSSFKVRDLVRISKYKTSFAKSYTPNFAITKTKNTGPQRYVVNDINSKTIVRTFYEKELQKIDQAEFRIEKAIKRKGDKLYAK